MAKISIKSKAGALLLVGLVFLSALTIKVFADSSTIPAGELITGDDCTYKSGNISNTETITSKVVDGVQLSGKQLHGIKTGGIAGFENVDFADGKDQFKIFYAGYASNISVDIILDSPNNGIYASVVLPLSSSGWSNYMVQNCTIPEISGIHNVYIRFKHSVNTGFLCNVPGFMFTTDGNPVPVTSVSLSETEYELTTGNKFTLNANVLPSDATYTGVNFTSSAPDIASVNATTGEVTGIKAGTAEITATSIHSSKNAVCTVNVVSSPVSGVTLNTDSIQIGENGTYQFTATVIPDTAVNKKVTFSSNSDAVASVDANGLLTAKSKGDAIITVTTDEGDFKDTCDIKVIDEVKATSITLDKTSISLDKGTIVDVSAVVAPDDVTVKGYHTVVVDPSVAKVDEQGRVIALSGGDTQIKFITNSTDAVEAVLSVHVTAPKATGTVTYSNPIIPGYAPDPSICSGKDGYYLVNSSFTSFPGIPVYFSKNMTDWELVSYAAGSETGVNFGSNYTNGGLWAPTIRYIKSKDAYYMIVKNMADSKTIITHTSDPRTEKWSAPVYIQNSSGTILTNVGIDPDLFEDVDGTVYYTDGNEKIATIDLDTGKIGTQYPNWSGLVDMFTEGPHIYRVGDYYYCTVAEGGTGADHMTNIARKPVSEGLIDKTGTNGWEVAPVYINSDVIQSCINKSGQNEKSILKDEIAAGNTVTDPSLPHNPILHNMNGLEIDTCGHSDLVKDENGNWWIVFLGRRDIMGPDLGRETNLAPVEWIDGWPVVNGGNDITPTMQGPEIKTDWEAAKTPDKFDFTSDELDLYFNYIRNPITANYSLTDNPGYLTLYAAADTIDGLDTTAGSNNGQRPSWVGIRQTNKDTVCTTAVDFIPATSTDAAGLTVYNTSDNQSGPYNAEFVIMKDGDSRKLVIDKGRNEYITSVNIPADGTVYLKIECVSKTSGNADMIFSYSLDETTWEEITTLDVGQTISRIQYTGLYLGMYATGRGTNSLTPAKFDYFTLDYDGKEEPELATDAEKLALQKAADTALNGIVESEYTPESYKALTDAVIDAKAVAVKADATQAEVDNAKTALETAQGNLQTKPIEVDKEQLQNLVNACGSVETAKYTDETASVFTQKLKEATDTLSKQDVTQAKIDEAYTALNNAKNSLESKPVTNITELQTLVNECGSVEQSKYTDETVSVFTQKLNEARNTLSKQNVTQSEINEAYTALNNAKNGLKLKDVTSQTTSEKKPELVLKSVVNAIINDEIINNIFTDADKNSGLDLKLEVDVADKEMSQIDKTAIDKVMSGHMTLGNVYDITLNKVIGSDKTMVTDLNGNKAKITVNIPENLRKSGREFSMIRVHDGVAEILKDVDSDANTITFETNKFSTYAIAYVDKAVATPDTTNPKTGMLAVIIPIVIIALGGVAFILKKKLIK